MELRKKSILIALVLGDGSLITQEKNINNKTYKYVTLEIGHSWKLKDYIEWKANLCRSLLGKKCLVKLKIIPERIINKKLVKSIISYRFSCTHKYFRILKKWLYPSGKKKFIRKYVEYLDELGLAIWYMDDGCTYILKNRIKTFSTEISTHIPKEDALDLIDMFNIKWNIKFHLHKKAENQYNIRAFSDEAFKFIKLILPFVPKCMDYKLKVPEYYIHECSTSYKLDEDIF